MEETLREKRVRAAHAANASRTPAQRVMIARKASRARQLSMTPAMRAELERLRAAGRRAWDAKRRAARAAAGDPIPTNRYEYVKRWRAKQKALKAAKAANGSKVE